MSPCLRAIVLEIMPERVASVGLTAIARQLEWMKALWNRRGTRPQASVAEEVRQSVAPAASAPDNWEALLGSAVIGLPVGEARDSASQVWWDAAQPGVGLYRLLVCEARASAVAAAAPLTTRLLLQHGGQGAARWILAEFWQQFPPFYTATDEARAFLRYLLNEHSELPGLAAAIKLDVSSFHDLCRSTFEASV